jgi:hypothetical protein
MSATKPIEYILEIYKPIELQELPAADECRVYHAATPFPAIHAGDLVTPWMWKFPDQSHESLKRAMGGREPSMMEPVAVVESVLHNLVDDGERIRYRLIVETKLYEPPPR